LVWVLVLIIVFWGHNFLALRGQVLGNRGISWGWGGGVSSWLAGGAFLILFFLTKKANFFGIKLMLLGGAINLLDRMIFGVVRDYWLFFAGVYNNVADWVIGFGLFIFVIELWKRK
jgi:lipoprotein signal peptidase